MYFSEYEKAQKRHVESLKNYNNLLTEKEQLVLQNKPTNNIDERIDKLRKIVFERNDQVAEIEKKLMKSENLEDKVYVCVKLQGMKVSQVSKKLFYSIPQIYRVIEKIQNDLNKS